MGLVTGVVLPNNGDRIKVENYNDPIQKILAQINGNLESTNIKPGSIAWESMAPFTNKIPASAMQDSANLEKFRNESSISFIASGLEWSSLTGLNGAMSAGVFYSTSGIRISVNAIASRTFTASRDTYVSISNTGVVGYSEVANGAVKPALPAGSKWLAKVVTNASAVTSVLDLRQTKPVNASITSPEAFIGRITGFTTGNVISSYDILRDDGNFFNSTWIAPYNCVVQASLSLRFVNQPNTSSGGRVDFQIDKNGAVAGAVWGTGRPGNNVDDIVAAGTYLIEMNAGDTIQARCNVADNAGALTSNSSYLSVVILSAK